MGLLTPGEFVYMVNADFMSQLSQGRGGSRFGAWDPPLTPRRVIALCSKSRAHASRRDRARPPPDLVNASTVDTQLVDGQPGKLTRHRLLQPRGGDEAHDQGDVQVGVESPRAMDRAFWWRRF